MLGSVRGAARFERRRAVPTAISDASVWCLLDDAGTQLRTGSTKTSSPALRELAAELGKEGDLIVGQEVGTQVYLVHDAISSAGVPVLSFNAAHLRVIAASRKKTDRRDAYWIAKSLQTGMTPHPVYVPGGEVRELRRLLARRTMVKRDLKRWQVRARSLLRAHGHRVRPGGHYINKLVSELLERPEGLDTDVFESLGMCERFIDMLREEVAQVDAMLATRTEGNEVVARLQTIPGIGPVAAATIYATVGDIGRFRNARTLAAYAGLVPTVRQSGDSNQLGRITKEGSRPLRSVLVQCAHVVTRTSTDAAAPLRAHFDRIRGTRGRRKIALVALARHLLRIAFHVWKDSTPYRAGGSTTA